jgi:hypothetical protein
MSVMDIFMRIFKKRQCFLFTPIDQNQDCVAENSVNLFQGNIIDDVLPLVFYEPSATQWLVHEESTHTGFYNTDLVFDEYKVEEDVQSFASSFTKISNKICPYMTIMTQNQSLVLRNKYLKWNLQKCY